MPTKKASTRRSSAGNDRIWTWEHGFTVLSTAALPAAKSTVSPSTLGMPCADRQAVIRHLKEGLPIAAFDRLQAALDVPSATLAGVANIAARTLARRKKEGRLYTDESERLWRLGALFDRAVEVLGDQETARHWFKTPKKALAGQSPLVYADTEPGAREVEDLLGRLEHGVFT